MTEKTAAIVFEISTTTPGIDVSKIPDSKLHARLIDEAGLFAYGTKLDRSDLLDRCYELAKQYQLFNKSSDAKAFDTIVVGGILPLDAAMGLGAHQSMPHYRYAGKQFVMAGVRGPAVDFYPIGAMTGEIQEDKKLMKRESIHPVDSAAPAKNVIVNVTTNSSMKEDEAKSARIAIGDDNATIWQISPRAAGNLILTPTNASQIVQEIANLLSEIHTHHGSVKYSFSCACPVFLAYILGNLICSRDKWGNVNILTYTNGVYSIEWKDDGSSTKKRTHEDDGSNF